MFGTITFNFTPPATESECSEVTMKFSSEADLKGMLQNFENFLRVLEYPLDVEDSIEVRYAKSAQKNSTELLKSSGKSSTLDLDWQIYNCTMNSSI